jgi:hypothetical protein
MSEKATGRKGGTLPGAQSKKAEYNLWGDLRNRIGNEEVIPVISNALLNNYIFDVDEDGRLGAKLQRSDTEPTENDFLAVDEQLAQKWAEYISYPFAERPLQLSRVAQYNLVNIWENKPVDAKRYYLTFLKILLLSIASNDVCIQADEDLYEWVDDIWNRVDSLEYISDIQKVLNKFSFSDLAVRLRYPRIEETEQNPLDLLAEMPLPIFVTTSHHDFMERALRKADKHPRVQVCPWNEDFGETPPPPVWFDSKSAPEDVDPDSEPTPVTPLVYHLYGYEKNPASLVITEDDYMDFLIKVSVEPNVIPSEMTKRMTQSSLLLLGYRIRSWDFRVLLKGIIRKLRNIDTSRATFNFAVQLDPALRHSYQEELDNARNYIETAYFPREMFKVEWHSSLQFIQKLHKYWRDSSAKPE